MRRLLGCWAVGTRCSLRVLTTWMFCYSCSVQLFCRKQLLPLLPERLLVSGAPESPPGLSAEPLAWNFGVICLGWDEDQPHKRQPLLEKMGDLGFSPKEDWKEKKDTKHRMGKFGNDLRKAAGDWAFAWDSFLSHWSETKLLLQSRRIGNIYVLLKDNMPTANHAVSSWPRRYLWINKPTVSVHCYTYSASACTDEIAILCSSPGILWQEILWGPYSCPIPPTSHPSATLPPNIKALNWKSVGFSL